MKINIKNKKIIIKNNSIKIKIYRNKINKLT
jgi:hypothetical protein